MLFVVNRNPSFCELFTIIMQLPSFEKTQTMGCCSSADDIDDGDVQRVWYYNDDNGLWLKMEAVQVKIIEQAYSNNKNTVEVKSEYGFKYKINFKKMTQTNTTSGKTRKIKFATNNTENTSDKINYNV